MNMRRVIATGIIFFGITGFFFSGDVLAAQKASIGTQVEVPAAPESQPDLIVYSAVIEPEPKAGDSIGKVAITVANQGAADAGESRLELTCMAEQCAQDYACQMVAQALATELVVPPLKSGASVKLEVVPTQDIKWVKGEFILVAVVDYSDQVVESNEVNNILKSAISITTVSPLAQPSGKN